MKKWPKVAKWPKKWAERSKVGRDFSLIYQRFEAKMAKTEKNY